jgi:hypothetical protein
VDTSAAAPAAAAKVLNPDISVIGDLRLRRFATADARAVARNARERSGFQEVIDPTPVGLFFSFGERAWSSRRMHHVHLLPPDCSKGKMRAAFGKVNTLHNHTLP